MEKEDLIRESVKQYFEINGEHYIPNFRMLNDDEKTHIVNIGTSIMGHYWDEFKFEPGSFIKNFLANDLERTFSSADSTNINAIRFYLMLRYNLEKPF